MPGRPHWPCPEGEGRLLSRRRGPAGRLSPGDGRVTRRMSCPGPAARAGASAGVRDASPSQLLPPSLAGREPFPGGLQPQLSGTAHARAVGWLPARGPLPCYLSVVPARKPWLQQGPVSLQTRWGVCPAGCRGTALTGGRRSHGRCRARSHLAAAMSEELQCLKREPGRGRAGLCASAGGEGTACAHTVLPQELLS